MQVFVRELAAADFEEQLTERRESLSWTEALYKTRAQELKGREQIVLNRERNTDAAMAAAVTMVTASQQECIEMEQQFDRRLKQVVVREQQLETCRTQLNGRSKNLDRRERQLEATQTQLNAGRRPLAGLGTPRAAALNRSDQAHRPRTGVGPPGAAAGNHPDEAQ